MVKFEALFFILLYFCFFVLFLLLFLVYFFIFYLYFVVLFLMVCIFLLFLTLFLCFLSFTIKPRKIIHLRGRRMDFLDKDNYLFREKPGYLAKGRVHNRHFKLLVEVSHLRSTKIIRALEGYLVQGKEAKDVCDQYRITSSYFLIALRRLQEISCCISCMIHYYSEVPPKATYS